MKLTAFAAPLLAFTLIAGPGVLMAQRDGYGPPPAPRDGYGQGGWDAAPPEFREVQRQGFHDGIEGAHRDMDNHRRPNVNNRDEYRHPNVPGRDRRDYKAGFARGYAAAWQHGNFGPGGPHEGYGPGNGYGAGPRAY